MVAFGGLVAVGAAPAFASGVATNAYTIGAPTGPVTNVAVSPTATTENLSSGYAVSFTATSALSSSDTITVSSSVALGSAPVSATVIDDTASTCFYNQTSLPGATPSSFTVTLPSNCSVAAGNKVEVDFTADPPTSAASYAFSVTTNLNATSATSNSVTNNSVPPTASSSSATTGANATYTISGVPITYASGASTTSTTTLTLTANLTANATALPTFYNGAGGYTVTYTPSGGAATSDPVTNANASGATVTLTLSNAIANGALNLTALATNPSSASAITFTVTPGGAEAETTTNDVTFGNSVSDVVVTPSPTVSGATATYVVSFKATDGIAVGGTMTFTESASDTNFSGTADVLIADSSQSWGHVVVAPTVASAGELELTLPAGDAVGSGDTVSATVPSVVNPSAGTVTDFTVTDSTDTVGQAAAPYTITVSGSVGITVSPNPTTPSVSSTYTISNLFATQAIAAGTAGDVIALTAPAGTLLPDAPGYYMIQDATTPSGSGAASSTNFMYSQDVACSPASGTTGCTAVSFEVPNNINNGDDLTVTVSDAVNPPTGTYQMGIGGDVGAPSAIAPFPDANVTYPNGAIVDFAGTDYVFAGGHPFGIATPAVLAKLQAVDHATVVKAAVGATLPTTAARAGTLISTNAINGTATIYVVGTDGQLHGFATAAQYLGDGYDPALNVTVPNLGGITVGSTAGVEGTAVTALATAASGAIVNSSGTFYLFDGGKAFGIPTPAALAIVRKSDMATTLTGAVTTADTSAAIATGTLITVSGAVYVANVGDLFPFKSMAQFDADGYAGTASVTSPNLGGLAVVTGYSGS
jgi:hypothetical protein